MSKRVQVRLLFVEGGAYHEETLSVPSEAIAEYERLIDYLREDPAVLKETYVDVARLCAAWLVEEEPPAKSARGS